MPEPNTAVTLARLALAAAQYFGGQPPTSYLNKQGPGAKNTAQTGGSDVNSPMQNIALQAGSYGLNGAINSATSTHQTSSNTPASTPTLGNSTSPRPVLSGLVEGVTDVIGPTIGVSEPSNTGWTGALGGFLSSFFGGLGQSIGGQQGQGQSQNTTINNTSNSTPNGILGGIKSILSNPVNSATNLLRLLQIRQEIRRIKDPIGFARRQGRAERAYDDGRYPNTNDWERLGIPGIQGAMQSASIGNDVAGAAHRQAKVSETEMQQKIRLLRAQTAKEHKNALLIGHQATSEAERAKHAATREWINQYSGSFIKNALAALDAYESPAKAGAFMNNQRAKFDSVKKFFVGDRIEQKGPQEKTEIEKFNRDFEEAMDYLDKYGPDKFREKYMTEKDKQEVPGLRTPKK